MKRDCHIQDEIGFEGCRLSNNVLMEAKEMLRGSEGSYQVAVADFEQYKFYVLPLAKALTSSPVSVAYQIDKASTVDTRTRDCESDDSLAEEHGGPDTFGGRGPANDVEDRLFQKNYICADPSYLKTLGQAHSGWTFGGIAELVDNSRDAKASK